MKGKARASLKKLSRSDYLRQAPENGQPRLEMFPAGAVDCDPDEDLSSGPQYSAKGPVSRILSCAVIPLGAALPRTLISDLPGGFGDCIESSLKERCTMQEAAWAHRADAQRRLAPGGRFPPYLVLLRVGFTLPRRYRRSGALLPHHFTLTPALEFPQRRAYPASRANSGIAFPGRPSSRIRRSGRGSRGGIFSVALAVHGF